MMEIKERGWYNHYGEFELVIKVESASVQELMKLQGIANRAGKDIRAILESNPLIIENSGSQYAGYTLPYTEKDTTNGTK